MYEVVKVFIRPDSYMDTKFTSSGYERWSLDVVKVFASPLPDSAKSSIFLNYQVGVKCPHHL